VGEEIAVLTTLSKNKLSDLFLTIAVKLSIKK